MIYIVEDDAAIRELQVVAAPPQSLVIAADLPHDRALEVRRPRALAACRVHQRGVSRQLIAEFD